MRVAFLWPFEQNVSPVLAGSLQSRVEQMKIPLNLPFTKGDFLFPPFQKRGEGGFLDKREL